MNVKLGFKTILLAAALAAMLIAPAESWAQKSKKPGGGGGGGGGGPTLIDLHPAGAVESIAWGISDAGQVIGEVDGVAGTWDGNATPPLFTSLPGAGASARGQNEAGEIVGFSGGGVPYYWESASSNPIELPVTGGQTGTAVAISLDGVIVGTLDGVTPVAWRVVSGSVFGPVVLSAGDGIPYDVAVSGASTNRVVGETLEFGATFWDLQIPEPDNGTFSVTSSSPAHPGLGPWSIATAITSDGDVTGQTDTARGSAAFVIRSGSLSILSNPRKQWFGIGEALNANIVVGSTGISGLARNASKWDSQGRVSTLLPSAWSGTEALGVNASGAIVGWGNHAGTWKAWLLR